MEVDKVLVSVGRKPYTEGLNLSKVGVKKDGKIGLKWFLCFFINLIWVYLTKITNVRKKN